jgi:hypothetical protein
VFSVRRNVPLLPALPCWSKIGIDRNSQDNSS